MVEYHFRKGAQIKGVDARTVGAELTKIRTRDGNVTTKSVMQAARPKKAPLHPVFEWRDDVAGEKYREWQARALIRSVRVTYEDSEQDEPLMVHVRSEEPYYQDARLAARQMDEAAAVVDDFVRRLASLQRSLKEFEVMMGESEEPERMARVTTAIKSLDVAHEAIRGLAH